MLKRRLVAILLVAVLAVACDADERKKLAKASDDFARGIAMALALDDALIKQKVISNDDAIVITSAILDANRIARQFNDRASLYGKSGGSTKSELLQLTSDIDGSLATLQKQGVLRIKNPASQAQFTAALAIMKSAVAVAQAILGGSK